MVQEAAFAESVAAMYLTETMLATIDAPAGNPVPDAPTQQPPCEETVELNVADPQVAIGIDGSGGVRSIPADLPEDEPRRIAQVAADSAAQQIQCIIRRGRPIRSADRRHVTKAARAAVLASVGGPVATAA